MDIMQVKKMKLIYCQVIQLELRETTGMDIQWVQIDEPVKPVFIQADAQFEKNGKLLIFQHLMIGINLKLLNILN